MIELQQAALIEISGDDLAAILTESFCGGYTPFKTLVVAEVTSTDDGAFQLQLVSRAEGESS